jgi:hypothetical protein
MTETSLDCRPWLLVRQGPLAPEERRVLHAVRQRLSREGHEFVTVLLGSSTYDADAPVSGPDGPGEEWILEDDARGRAIRRPNRRPGRTVTAEELVQAIMTAEKVIQFP